MKVLLLAATAMELKRIPTAVQFPNLELHQLVTGIGMTATAYHLSKKVFENQYDLAINLGVAGAFNRDIQLGEVVEVQCDRFSELGAEDGSSFLELHEMQLMPENEFPFSKNQLHATAPINSTLRKVSGITVNKVHGNETSIEEVMQRFNPDVESMEGAAFMYVCNMEKIPCMQLRAISNYVERRDKEKWQINKALEQLGMELENYLKLL